MSSSVTSRLHQPQVRTLVAATAMGLMAAGGVVAPAHAADPTCVPTAETTTATATVEAQGLGGTLRLTGAGWCHPDENGGGSVVAIKIDEGTYSRTDSSLHANRTIWAIVRADDATGTLDARIPLPDGTTVGPNGSTPAFTLGTHSLRLLSGSLKAGDQPRTVLTSSFDVVAVPKVVAAVPRVSGTARVGRSLAANPGSWTAGATLTYQWLRAGQPIARATARSYVPVAADRGRALSVRVTGTKAGHESAQSVSPAVRIGFGTLRAPRPLVAGQAKVGKRLVAKRGSWTAGTKVSYRWYVNGKAVRGATKSAFRPAKNHRGKRVTVRVTGKKPGYATAIRTSKRTAKVKR